MMRFKEKLRNIVNERPWAKEVLLTVFFLGGLSALFGVFYNELVGRYNITARKQLKLAGTNKNDIQVVSLGSSHADHNVKPQFFSIPTVSFASPGQDLFETAYQISAIAPMFPKLKTVLISVSYFSFLYDNGRYKGRYAMKGRRIKLYSRFNGGMPYWGDMEYYIKGKFGDLITRDHLSAYFLYRLKWKSFIPLSWRRHKKPGDNRWQFRYDDSENTIAHQIYVDMNEHLSLIGYAAEPENRLFTCNQASIVWYWYCRKKIPDDLRIRAFVSDGSQKVHEVADTGDYLRFFPLSKWRPGTIVKYMQRVTIPPGWNAQKMKVALMVERRNRKINQWKDLHHDIEWPSYELIYPIEKLDPAPTNYPHIATLYDHSCMRSQNQSDIMDDVLDIRPTIVDDSYAVIKNALLKLKAAGIRPILYTAPFHRTYNARYRKRYQDIMYERVRMLVKDAGVEYYDFSRDSRFERKPALFLNTDHLNDTGAKIFTSLINKIATTPPVTVSKI